MLREYEAKAINYDYVRKHILMQASRQLCRNLCNSHGYILHLTSANTKNLILILGIGKLPHYMQHLVFDPQKIASCHPLIKDHNSLCLKI